MQRKGGTLMQLHIKLQSKREGFSIITAVFVLVLMSTVAMFIVNISSKIVKETSDQYQKEQSVLLAKSYTEYAIMAVTANEHNSTNCLNKITGTFGIYNIVVNISYIGNDANLGSGSTSSCSRKLSTSVVTPKSPLNIVVDTFVSYPEIDRPAGTGTPNITYHRRSLQKI